MTLHAIGDIQGCLAPLKRLLAEIDFEPGRDHLWFAGDLVNRGPDSLQVMRFVRGLGDSATTVLGNHDLHLLAVAAGVTAPKRRDTLEQVLAAPDRDELLDWLRHRPLAVREHGYLLVHAGLSPKWSAKKTVTLAAEVEAVLRGPGCNEFLGQMYGNQPARWKKSLAGVERLRCIVNFLTRVRYCDSTGAACLEAKGPPGSQPAGCVPWFRFEGRKSAGHPVVFGHWSTLGLIDEPDVIALDTGCVWGGALSAMALAPRGPAVAIGCDRTQAPQRA